MQVYTGIDWSENKHDVLFMNEKGAVITYFHSSHAITVSQPCRLKSIRNLVNPPDTDRWITTRLPGPAGDRPGPPTRVGPLLAAGPDRDVFVSGG